MVEPLSAGVVAVLIAKALDRAEDGVVDSAVQVARRAVEALRRRFAADPEAEQALESVVEVPDSEKRQRALAELLQVRAEQSAELREELKSIAEEFEGAGKVGIGDIKQDAEGKDITQIGGVANSQININQGSSPRPLD